MKGVDNLFSKVPDTIFGPLASPRKLLHWQVLTRLYQNLFDDDIEYSDYGYSRVAVIDVIDNVLAERSDLWVSDVADEGVQIEQPKESATPQRMRANIIYYTLRGTGWLEEERRAYNDYVIMPSRVSQLLAMLIELSEGRALIVTGKLKTLEAGMRQVLTTPEERADVLVELAKDARRFARHLSSIRGAIKGLYDQIRGNLSTREIVSVFFDDFLRDIFIRDYATIKTSENPLRIRDELLRIVTELRYSPDLKHQLLNGYSRLYSGKDEKEISSHLEQDLSRLELVFVNIEHQLDAIDSMKVRYERRVDTVIDYATRTPRSLGRDLRRLARALSSYSESNEDPQVLLPLLLPEGVGESRVARPKRPRIAPTPRAVQKSKADPEMIARAERERQARQAIRITDDALLTFLEVQLGGRDSISLAEVKVRTIRDYFCVLALRRAVKSPHLASREFPGTLRGYGVDADDSWAETEFFNMPSITVKRRGAA